MVFHSFEDLHVWQRSTRLAVSIYKDLGHVRDWGLRDQIQRSAVSIPANLAEGAERDSRAEFRRFARIAKGSAGELRTLLYISQEAEILERELVATRIREIKEIAAMLQSLVRTLAEIRNPDTLVY